MQHAFGFMGASGRKSDLLKTKKKEKRERIEEKNETRGNMLEEKLFAWPTSGKGQHEGGDRHTVAAASRR